jgi:hypothetical protein
VTPRARLTIILKTYKKTIALNSKISKCIWQLKIEPNGYLFKLNEYVDESGVTHLFCELPVDKTPHTISYNKNYYQTTEKAECAVPSKLYLPLIIIIVIHPF